MNRPRLAPAAPFLLVLLATPALAQRGDRVLADEMSFARELAVRYQYMDLAESVLSSLSKDKLNDKQKEKLSLVECQVYTEGAKREGDSKKRLALFDKAASSYRDFFQKHPFSEILVEAERSYLGLVNNYGRALEIALTEAIGDEATALRETVKTVLDDGLERTSSLKDAYDRPDLSPAEKLDRWRLMLDRGQMLMTLGNVTPDPEFYYSQAAKEFERVATEAGETSGPGLNAFLALAKLNRARGRLDDAVAFAEFVVTTSVPVKFDLDEWKELPFEAKAERFKLVELALPDLIEALASQGKTGSACSWSLYFYNAWKREGFTISPFGYVALLSAARILLDSGGYVGGSLAGGNLRWFETEEEMSKAGFSARDSRSALDLALKTAQDVNTDNKGNTLQIRAQKLISDVISRPGVVVPPDVLYEAALGEYNSRNYGTAIDSMRDVLRALDTRDDATRREYMPKVLYHVGASFARMDRSLEAAMAFREVCTTWKGDPEFQVKAADGLLSTIREVRTAAKGDPVIEQLYLEAERIVIEAKKDTGGADSVTWQQGQRAYDAGNYDQARKSYLTIGQGADEHERAIVKAALCLYKKNDKDGAAKEFESYLKVFVPNPQNAISGARKVAAREEASAQATYYLGKMAFDTQDFADVVKVFNGYEKTFPSQTEYAPNALYMLTLAHIGLKDLGKAKAVEATMQQVFPTSSATGKAAFNLYQTLKTEQEAAEKAGETERSIALKKEMAHYIHVSNETSSDPSFGALRVESSLWLELQEWAKAEEVLRATLAASKDKKDRADDLERFVLPDLGEALLGQKRVPEAFEVLDPLVPKEESDTRKPASTVVHDWCRSVTGWVEPRGDELVEVPGVGGDFAHAIEFLNKLIDQEKFTNSAWSCPWYALKFQQAYGLLQWSKADSSQREVAKRVLDDIVSQLGDPDLKDVAAKCGDETLRKQYLWLKGQLR